VEKLAKTGMVVLFTVLSNTDNQYGSRPICWQFLFLSDADKSC